MQALVIILNQMNFFEALLKEFNDKELYGGTIIDTQGLASAIAANCDGNTFGTLRMMLHGSRPFNKTIVMLLEEDKVQVAIDCVKTVMGNLNEPNKGIIFTTPISFVDGLDD